MGACGDGTSAHCCEDPNHPHAADDYNGGANCRCDISSDVMSGPCPYTCYGMSCQYFDDMMGQITGVCDYMGHDIEVILTLTLTPTPTQPNPYPIPNPNPNTNFPTRTLT